MQHDTVRMIVDVPAAVADEGTPARARLLLVLDAVRSERLGWRAAAGALGLSLSEFLDIAREYEIPVSRPDLDDLREDLSTLDRIIQPSADSD